jgi:hypothetical protein
MGIRPIERASQQEYTSAGGRLPLEHRPNVPTGTFRFAGFLRRKLLIPGAGFQTGQWTQRVSRGRNVYFRGG